MTDACGNAAKLVLRTATWTVVTTPIFANCGQIINLNSNPQNLPTCVTLDNPIFGGLVTASNECGNVPVTCEAGPITIVGCGFSQVFTFTATACGLSNTCTRTFNWTNCGSIGNFVWNDLDQDGIQDVGELGIAGVAVTLSGCGISLTTTTDANGSYLFSNLPPCIYTVTFGTPSGYISSTANQGVNDAIDSDSVGGVVIVTLGLGENNLTIDAGYFIPALEGCTLGYWKNHTNRWCGSYRTCDRFGDVFTSAPASLANLTLLQALNLGGGGINNLARQGVAALLNACSGNVAYAGYGDNPILVIAAINLAYTTGGTAPGTLGSQLDVLNNSGCPLGGTRATTATNCARVSGSSNRTLIKATVYPNPFSNNFKLDVKTESSEDLQVKVYDMLGKLIGSNVLKVSDINAFEIGESYPSGIYNVILTQGAELKTLRVIKR